MYLRRTSSPSPLPYLLVLCPDQGHHLLPEPLKADYGVSTLTPLPSPQPYPTPKWPLLNISGPLQSLPPHPMAKEGRWHLRSWALGPLPHQDCPRAPSRTLGPNLALSSFGRTTSHSHSSLRRPPRHPWPEPSGSSRSSRSQQWHGTSAG